MSRDSHHLRLTAEIGYLCACVIAVVCGSSLMANAQGYTGLPFMSTGAGDAAFSQLDFAVSFLDSSTKAQNRTRQMQEDRQHLVDSGAMSALDLDASDKAVDYFNRGSALMKEQKSKEAIVVLQKAIAAYPKFVSAHNVLGLAYSDQQDARAKEEFETAAKLDGKFAGSFLNLGMLALSARDYPSAVSSLERAASLNSKDAKSLAALAYAQKGNREFEQTLATVQKVHAMDHRGLATVHYVAASAAIALNNLDVVQRELTLFLAEDPTNPLAPTARHNLDILAKRLTPTAPPAGDSPATASSAAGHLQTFPNSDRLKSELKAAQSETQDESCPSCAPAQAPAPAPASAGQNYSRTPASILPVYAGGVFTLHAAVDETALFFAVSSHGRMVNDLELSDIKILDDSKPPEKIMQFIPQSKLPLRLGFLIDTSGSVQDRFKFEKRATERFLQRVLNPSLDLAFVLGFNSSSEVAQDFTSDAGLLAQGIEKLTNGGGTSLFDAISFASWKLEAYPEDERVARVLVILTDGEDNSSHRSLKQAIAQAERAGVTIYTVSTVEKTAYDVSSKVDTSVRTDADRVLELLAARSGGESMFPGDMETLNKSLDKLHDLIRSRYLVVYRPPDFAPNGQFRSVHVLAQRNGEHLHVHVRKGYDARLEGPPSLGQEGQHKNRAALDNPSTRPASAP